MSVKTGQAHSGDVGNGVAFASFDEPDPALVESVVALIAADPGRGRREVPAVSHGFPDPVAGAVVPGCLDQQPARVAVAGLGDRALGP